MTKIDKKLLEKELKRYKLLKSQKEYSNYYDGLIGVIRRLLKILDEGYVEEKDKTCPFIRRTGYAWQYICEGERCQCWSTKRNDCGLKRTEA